MVYLGMRMVGLFCLHSSGGLWWCKNRRPKYSQGRKQLGYRCPADSVLSLKTKKVKNVCHFLLSKMDKLSINDAVSCRILHTKWFIRFEMKCLGEIYSFKNIKSPLRLNGWQKLQRCQPLYLLTMKKTIKYLLWWWWFTTWLNKFCLFWSVVHNFPIYCFK